MKLKTRKQKILYGSAVAVAYLLSFVFMKSNNWGALPLVAATTFFAWLFYLTTDLDPLGIRGNKDAGSPRKQAERHSVFLNLRGVFCKRKKLLLFFLGFSIVISSFIFLKPHRTYKDCVLSYAVKAKSKVATSILEHACEDLYSGSKEERKIAKCHIKYISKANNDDAVSLAEETCDEIHHVSQNNMKVIEKKTTLFEELGITVEDYPKSLDTKIRNTRNNSSRH